MLQKIFLTLVALVFIAAGIGVARSWFKRNSKIRKCKTKVIARCIGAHTGENKSNITSYTVMFEYEYMGELVDAKGILPQNSEPYIGEQKEVYINPSIPCEVFDPNLKENHNSDLWLGLVIAMFGLLAGFISAVMWTS